MAWSLVVSVSAGSSDGNAVTTAGVDTTGADTLFAFVVNRGDRGEMPPADSKGNTWAGLTSQNVAGGAHGRWYYAKAATVGAGHTFTVSGIEFPTVIVYAFAGGNATAPFDAEAGAVGTFGTTGSPGSLTPGVDNELVLQGCASHVDVTYSLTGGYSTPVAVGADANHFGGGAAYLIQTTAGATNPTWTWSTNTTGAMCAASFKAAAGGGSVGSLFWYDRYAGAALNV